MSGDTCLIRAGRFAQRTRTLSFALILALCASPPLARTQDSAPPAPAAPPPSAAAPDAPAELPPEPVVPAEPEPPAAGETATPDAGVETGQPAAPAADVAAAGELVANPEASPPEGEMVVTAQRYEQDVQKTPVTVSAFSTRAMEQRGVTNLQDIGKFTPNVQLQPTNRPAGGGSAYAAYIRGIGTGDFQFPTDPGVGLYVDDVYIARTMGGLLSTDADIERIEVIKGPQGTLFGRNTIGGALNILSSKPRVRGPAIGSALVRLGNYGRRDFSLYANGPLAENVVGAKISFSNLHSDGYGERILDGENTNSEERFVVRGGLLFRFSDDVNLRIDADYSKQDQAPPAGQMLAFVPMGMTQMKIDKYNMIAAPALNPGLGLPPGSVFDQRWISPGDHKTYALQPMYDRYDIGGVSARLSYNPAAEFNIKSISAARFVSSHIAVDGDQTPYPVQSSKTALDDQQYSEELQFSGDLWDERLNYLVGLFILHETGDSTVDTQSYHGLFENNPMPLPQDAGDTASRFGLSATSYAAFTQETLTILDSLHVIAGARVNRDQKAYDYGVDFPQRGVPQIPQTHAEQGWTSFTPKVGLDWSPIEPVMIYASYAQGFKSGGFSASNNPMNPAPVYDPERVTAYELGVKTHWFEGRRLMTNIAAFFNDYRDIQLTVQSVDPITNANVRTTQNAGASKIKGFEAEVIASPLRELSLNGGIGYVDAKFDSLTPVAMTSGFKVGDRLPQIPDWTISGGAQYGFPIGVGELTVRGDVAYKGDQFLTAIDPSSHQPGYTLLAARLSFVPDSLPGLEISVYGVNLTDQRYYIYRATLAPTGQEVGIPGTPRLIYGNAKYTF
jgi:iron complex outermembrane receptor protein